MSRINLIYSTSSAVDDDDNDDDDDDDDDNGSRRRWMSVINSCFKATPTGDISNKLHGALPGDKDDDDDDDVPWPPRGL